MNNPESELLRLAAEAQAEKDVFEIKQKQEWNAKAKKNAIYSYKKDGKTYSMPVMSFLKEMALSLPKMKRGNQLVIHFEELRYRFMKGRTKEESMLFVNEYCKDIVNIYNKSVDAFNASKKD